MSNRFQLTLNSSLCFNAIFILTLCCSCIRRRNRRRSRIKRSYRRTIWTIKCSRRCDSHWIDSPFLITTIEFRRWKLFPSSSSSKHWSWRLVYRILRMRIIPLIFPSSSCRRFYSCCCRRSSRIRISNRIIILKYIRNDFLVFPMSKRLSEYCLWHRINSVSWIKWLSCSDIPIRLLRRSEIHHWIRCCFRRMLRWIYYCRRSSEFLWFRLNASWSESLFACWIRWRMKLLLLLLV